MTNLDFDGEFSAMFSQTEGLEESAPPSLKARLYSALVRRQQASGALASLDATVASGHGICVFEKLVQIAPVGEAAKSPFFCQMCHARILGEHWDHAPIFWSNCPYVQFRKS